MEAKNLCKILHLAGFHGWRPERLSAPLPSASWNTELILPQIKPYLVGVVSQNDAASLASGLIQMIAAEGHGLSPGLHFAALAVLAVASDGTFEVAPQTDLVNQGA
jgi:hypothetical protein